MTTAAGLTHSVAAGGKPRPTPDERAVAAFPSSVARAVVTKPVRGALFEMLRFGALVRDKREGAWRSCNDRRFYDSTAQTLLRWDFAILSVNAKKPGRQFIRLTDKGKAAAQMLATEADALAAARSAIAQTNIALTQAAPGRSRP